MSKLTIKNNDDALCKVILNENKYEFVFNNSNCILIHPTIQRGCDNTTTYSYGNIDIECVASGVIIKHNFNEYINFETHGYSRINFKQSDSSIEVIITPQSDNYSITKVIINDHNGNKNSVYIDNHLSSLQKIVVNSNTVFSNFNTQVDDKISITISKNNDFKQTNNDLWIGELMLGINAKITYSFNKKEYSFANLRGNGSDIIIDDFDDFVEAALNPGYLRNNTREYNADYIALFLSQNEGIALSGDSPMFNMKVSTNYSFL